MNTKLSTAQRIRALVEKGYRNRDIVRALGCKPQAVYNARYQINKARGLGSIGTLPKLTNGIGAPPKRKYTRRIRTETGIAIHPAQNAYQFAPASKYTPMPEMQIIMVEPTLWQRIKGWFGG